MYGGCIIRWPVKISIYFVLDITLSLDFEVTSVYILVNRGNDTVFFFLLEISRENEENLGVIFIVFCLFNLSTHCHWNVLWGSKSLRHLNWYICSTGREKFFRFFFFPLISLSMFTKRVQIENSYKLETEKKRITSFRIFFLSFCFYIRWRFSLSSIFMTYLLLA